MQHCQVQRGCRGAKQILQSDFSGMRAESRTVMGALDRSVLAFALIAGTSMATPIPPSRASEKPLYRLETTCTLDGGAPQDCVVEVSDLGDTTLYRHTIGSRVETIQVSGPPLRMGRLNPSTYQWQPLNSVRVRFSTNTVCFNNQDLCVVNTNYLNSVREERIEELEGRDLVMVRFDGDGQTVLSCYDQGCEGLL